MEKMGDKSKVANQIIVFTGSGVGKTVAAIGIAMRTISIGGKVIFVYFTGPQHPTLGEVKTAAATSINWRMIGIKSEAKDPSYLDDFSESVDTVEEAINMAQTTWSSECDLLVLDNITHHIACSGIDIAQVIALIDNRPTNTSIVLTGVSAPDLLIDKADVVTEFLEIKQPTNSDMHLRKGIDF